MNTIDPEKIFSIDGSSEFKDLAIEIFRFQAVHNPVYNRYLELMNIRPGDISEIENIPFLPVEFFKTHKVITGNRAPELVFESSGTTGEGKARHHIADASLYRKTFINVFKHFYGPPGEYCILALLPSYLERKNSSLVYMAEHLIRMSQHPQSGFYLNDFKGLLTQIAKLENAGQKSILIGVSFALLELAERYRLPMKHTLIMETGGMKGRRQEITRQELHSILMESFGLKIIHSEYGMTELLSQAYARRDGIFHTPPWMKVLIRDPYDPLSSAFRGSSGGINIIDLANIHSCSFLATQDLGKITSGDGFEIMGRFDQSDIRGCNLMLD